MVAANRSYVVVGFGGSHNDFTDIRFPAMSPTGATTDTQNCSMCHVNGSEQKLPTGLESRRRSARTDQSDPSRSLRPAPVATSTFRQRSHALANPTHSGKLRGLPTAGAQFAVDKVHAQY